MPKVQRMPSLYKNKYRNESTRRHLWNYASEAAYFVTICTADRRHFFGEIADQKMSLSAIGKIVDQEWVKTPAIRPDMNLTLDAWVVMPNHFHAILCIGQNEFNSPKNNNVVDDGGGDLQNGIGSDDRNIVCRDAMHRVPTNNIDTDNHDNNNDGIGYKNAFAPQSKNLASVIRGFKSAVTMQARRIDPNFGWQSRFHDHIIRNVASHQRIRNYIIDNPNKWEADTFNQNKP